MAKKDISQEIAQAKEGWTTTTTTDQTTTTATLIAENADVLFVTIQDILPQSVLKRIPNPQENEDKEVLQDKTISGKTTIENSQKSDK